MLRFKCWVCGKEIKGNEHFFLFRGKTICKKCDKKMNYHHRIKSEMVSGIPDGMNRHVHSAATPSSQ